MNCYYSHAIRGHCRHEDCILRRKEIMQITKKEETKKEFTPAEWAKFDRRKRNQLRKELDKTSKEVSGRRKCFYVEYENPYKLYSYNDLGNFLMKRTKLVLMEFPKSN